MKELFLVRHAHAAAGTDDHARPLSPEGERVAERAGRHLADAGCTCQLALLSSALRVTQTWERIRAALPAIPRVETLRSLYLADVEEMHARLLSLPDSVGSAVIVGHNPGISRVATWLISTGPDELVDRLQRGFAPGGVAALALRVPNWGAVGARCGELRGFWD